MRQAQRVAELVPSSADPAAYAAGIRRITDAGRNVRVADEPPKIICGKQSHAARPTDSLAASRICINIKHPDIVGIEPAARFETVLHSSKKEFKGSGLVVGIVKG